MQKNVCLQQDICLYPDKTLQKLKSASSVISARSMSHNTHLRYNFTDKTFKKKPRRANTTSHNTQS